MVTSSGKALANISCQLLKIENETRKAVGKPSVQDQKQSNNFFLKPKNKNHAQSLDGSSKKCGDLNQMKTMTASKGYKQ